MDLKCVFLFITPLVEAISFNFGITCVIGFWSISLLEVSTNSIQTSVGMTLCLSFLIFINQDVEMDLTMPIVVGSRSFVRTIKF